MRPHAIATFLLLLALLVPCVRAANAESAMDKAMAKSEGVVAKPALDVVESNPAMPAAPSGVVLSDPTTRARYLTAMQRYYEYRANGYAYRSRVFEWQLLSSRAIFTVVLVLVGAGIYFAAVQFRVAMLAAGKEARRAVIAETPAADAPTGDSPLATRLEISAKGVVVNSSVLGVIILALSLAFFYLYLVYVYPIQNVF